MRFILEIELDTNNWGRIQAVLQTLSNDLTYFPASRNVEVDHGSVSGPEGAIVGKWEAMENAPTQRFVVSYTRIPTNYHDRQTALVDAATADDAEKIVRHSNGDFDEWTRKHVYNGVKPYEPLAVQGRIVKSF